MAKMIPTSIKKLDEHLNGGFPQGSIVLFSATPAIDVDAFVMQAFYSTLLEGDKGVFHLDKGGEHGLLIDDLGPVPATFAGLNTGTGLAGVKERPLHLRTRGPVTAAGGDEM